MYNNMDLIFFFQGEGEETIPILFFSFTILTLGLKKETQNPSMKK